ncbi:MAG: GTP-binding protein [Gammaproteobacteria bacterium]|nr:GTP-binding protein [Gammaproteobacteria bacterium]
MDTSSEALPELATHGIGLSVTAQDSNCVLELRVNPGQLAIARCVIEHCQHEWGVSLVKVDGVPEVDFEKIESEPRVSGSIKIGVVGAYAGNKPCLLEHYVKENFSGTRLKENLFAQTVKDKIHKNNHKIPVEIRKINTSNFAWDKELEYLNSVDAIVLTVNATTKTGDSLASIKEVFQKIISHLWFPEIPLIVVGIRSESSKLPRQEMIEAFAEVLGVPYVECFVNKGMFVTPIFKMILDMIHKEIPVYKYRVTCKNVMPEVLQNPDFYRKLNEKVLNNSPKVQSISFSFEPRLNLYCRVSNYLEQQECYLALLNFHLMHMKSGVVTIQKHARAYVLQLEKSPLGQVILSKLIDELGQGSTETKNIISMLSVLSNFVNLKLYSLTVTVNSAYIKPMCDFLRNNKQLVNLILVFKGNITEADLVNLGIALRICALKRLKFVMHVHFSLKSCESFKDVFESHPTLLSLDFSDCRLSSKNVAEIIEAVSQNVILRELNVSGNYLAGDAVHEVKRLLQKSRQIQKISISNGQVGMSELSRVLSGVLPRISLTTLDISRNRLSEFGVAYLLKGLSNNPQLSTLDVSFCAFSFAAMDVFLGGIEKIESLRSLSLAGNFSRPAREWLVKILEVLEINKALKKINLSQNPFLDEGAELAANFLRHNKTLEYLDLSNTQMTDAGLVALTQVLHINHTLHELIIRKNRYTSIGTSTLLFALSKNTGLFSLDIAGSIECKEALSSLIGLIPENLRLKAFGFMPDPKKRTVELVTLYNSAFLGNKVITSTHDDFSCRCGRCLCVKSTQIVSLTAENRFYRYKNLALLIKAYLDPREDFLEMLAFKRIPKDVLSLIFKMAYPELPQKVFTSISSNLFFKHRNTVVPVTPRFQVASVKTTPVRLNFCAVDVLLEQDNEDVVLTLSSDVRDYESVRQMAEICREKLHLLLPYNNKCEVDVVCINPAKQAIPHDDSEDEMILRVALMGEVACGKTAFAKRFAHNIYSESFKASIGVDFLKKTVMLEKIPCNLQIFDLAGTRPKDTFTRIYLRDTNAILLMVDLTRPQGYEETYQRILYETAFPDIPVLMVGLKSDISRHEAVVKFRAIAEKLNIPCIVSSAKTPENVNDVFDVVLRMIVGKKVPGYRAQLRIKKITLDWFVFPRFYGDLNQLFLEGMLPYRSAPESNLNYQYYLGALKWLREKNDPKAVCRFFIKNMNSFEDLVKADATKNLEHIRNEMPECLKAVFKQFHEWLAAEGANFRYEAIEGLRTLGELHTQTVKSICLRVLERIHFSSNYALDTLVKKIKDYNRPDLIRASLSALSEAHVSCFSILKEMSAKQACEHIESRVLEELEVYLKRLQHSSPDFSSGNFRLLKK